MVFREKFRREFQRESFFTWNTSRSKLPDMFHVSYVTRAIRPMLGCDVIGETYRKSLLLYSGANSRVVRLSIGHWCATVKVSHRGVCERESKRGHFRTKMARIPRRNDQPMENTLWRERCANRQPCSAHVPSSAAVNQHFQTASKPSFWSSSPNTRSLVRALSFFPP